MINTYYRCTEWLINNTVSEVDSYFCISCVCVKESQREGVCERDLCDVVPYLNQVGQVLPADFGHDDNVVPFIRDMFS